MYSPFSGLTRALLTLPRDIFGKLIVLEEQPGRLDYLEVTEPFGSPAHSMRSISRQGMGRAGEFMNPVLYHPSLRTLRSFSFGLSFLYLDIGMGIQGSMRFEEAVMSIGREPGVICASTSMRVGEEIRKVAKHMIHQRVEAVNCL